MDVFSGKQSWRWIKISPPCAKTMELCKQISLSDLDRHLQIKTIQRVYALPPQPVKPIHSAPFQLSVLRPALSRLVIFQESCWVGIRPSVAPSAPALTRAATASHLTLKINREPQGLRRSEWDKPPKCARRVQGPYWKQLASRARPP